MTLFEALKISPKVKLECPYLNPRDLDFSFNKNRISLDYYELTSDDWAPDMLFSSPNVFPVDIPIDLVKGCSHKMGDPERMSGRLSRGMNSKYKGLPSP